MIRRASWVEGERFRTRRMQLLKPVLALMIVGTLLVSDLTEEPVRLISALVGGAVGYAFGAYRARETFVASVPAHGGVILRTTVESFGALGVLIVIKWSVEQDWLPDSGVFPVVVAALLAFIVMEPCARVYVIMRRYEREAAALSSASPTTCRLAVMHYVP